MHVLHDQFEFFHKSRRRQGMKFAPFKLVFQFAAAIEHEGQRRKHGRLDFIDGMGGGKSVALGAFYACDAEDDHDGELHSRGDGALTYFDGLLAVYSFADLFQCLGIAAFHTVVEQGEACFSESGEFFHGFAEDISRRGVRRYSF